MIETVTGEVVFPITADAEIGETTRLKSGFGGGICCPPPPPHAGNMRMMAAVKSEIGARPALPVRRVKLHGRILSASAALVMTSSLSVQHKVLECCCFANRKHARAHVPSARIITPIHSPAVNIGGFKASARLNPYAGGSRLSRSV